VKERVPLFCFRRDLATSHEISAPAIAVAMVKFVKLRGKYNESQFAQNTQPWMFSSGQSYSPEKITQMLFF